MNQKCGADRKSCPLRALFILSHLTVNNGFCGTCAGPRQYRDVSHSVQHNTGTIGIGVHGFPGRNAGEHQRRGHTALHGTSSAYVGELFNFIMGSVFSFSAGFLYQRNKSRKGALLGSVLGAALMAVLSVPFNYFLVYPAYVVCYGLPLDAIIGMYQAILPSSDSLIKCLTIFNMPFTFCKGMLDVALCFLVYKPLSPLLHK